MSIGHMRDVTKDNYNDAFVKESVAKAILFRAPKNWSLIKPGTQVAIAPILRLMQLPNLPMICANAAMF